VISSGFDVCAAIFGTDQFHSFSKLQNFGKWLKTIHQWSLAICMTLF
jgi:phosphomevalonate kinase